MALNYEVNPLYLGSPVMPAAEATQV
jgi:hypothetical protein